MNIYIPGIEFNSREAAVFVWFLIFSILGIFQDSIRKSFLEICKILFDWKIFILISATAIYSLLVVFVLHELGIWQLLLIKDTIYWFIGTALVSLLGINEANQDGFFKKILIDNLKIIIFIEFVVNFYTFNFFVELMFVPCVFFIAAMSVLAEARAEYFQLKKILNFCLVAIGSAYIFYAATNVFSDYEILVNAKNIGAFLLPLILTVAFIPFLYFIALFSAYEVLFMRRGVSIKGNPELLHFSKVKILQFFQFNLSGLNRFSREASHDLMGLNNESDVLKVIENFKKKEIGRVAS